MIDVVILGALGFTGKQVLKEALKFFNPNNFTFLAIAGHDPSKLAQTLKWAQPSPTGGGLLGLGVEEEDCGEL